WRHRPLSYSPSETAGHAGRSGAAPQSARTWHLPQKPASRRDLSARIDLLRPNLQSPARRHVHWFDGRALHVRALDLVLLWPGSEVELSERCLALNCFCRIDRITVRDLPVGLWLSGVRAVLAGQHRILRLH